MALTKIKTSNLETSIDLTGINDTATSQILTVSDTGIDVTGTVTMDGGSTSADFSFGDNDKAIFGAGSDLQIYHDANNSFIKDSGTGSLYVQADAGVYITNASGSENKAIFTSDGAVNLYHDNALKFATTSSGIDVTGTVTADGLTVDGTTVLDIGDEGTLQVGPTTTVADENQTIEMRGSNGSNALQRFQIANSGEHGEVDFKYGRADATPTKVISIGPDAGDISFYEDTGTTAKFFWDASAERLGIGGIPENELDVRGTVEIGNGSTNRMYLGYSGSDFRLYDRAATTERMRIDSSGNVGIGTSSPDKPLHINTSNSGAAQDYIKTGGTSRYGNGLNKLISFHHGYWGGSQEVASVGVETTSSAGGAGHGYGNLVFYTGESGNGDSGSTSTERMRINSGGNCSIGETSNPGYRLSLKHTGTVQLNNRDGSDGANILFQRSGTNVGSITVTSSSTTYATSSDYRLKENVVPMTGSIDRLKALNPSRFNFIADPDTTVDGFLAHEAQEVVPEAITGTKDAMRTEEYEVTPAVEATYDDDDNELTPAVEAVMGEREVPDMQGIDQAKLVPLLVGALQEQQTLIESLTTRLEALEGV